VGIGNGYNGANMRQLAFGGSFNPIHHAHLICARAIAEAGGFDKVVLIPSAQPPHKPNAPDLAAAEDRLAMCRLAASSQECLFEVDDVELARGGSSYTIDTVRLLKQRGWEEVHWLIGADMLRQLPTWHQPDDLLREMKFAIIERPGWGIDWAAMPDPYRSLRQSVWKAPAIDISATDIRRRVAAGLSIEFLTTPFVIEYIRAHRLYR